MRIADVHCARSFEHVPAQRHLARVHRVSEGDVLPVEPSGAHRSLGHVRSGTDPEHPASGLYAGLGTVQHAHGAGGISARLNLAAIGIVDAHGEVRRFRWSKHDQLVEADPAITIGQRADLRCA